MMALSLLLVLVTAFQLSSAQVRNSTQILLEGTSLNIPIRCGLAKSYPSISLYWRINGALYYLLHLPEPFMISARGTDLVIPAPDRRLDGYTLQCVSIQWAGTGNSTVNETLGRITTLDVLHANKDTFELDYQALVMNDTTLQIHSTPCRQAFLKVEGFLLDQVLSDNLTAPQVVVNASPDTPNQVDIPWSEGNGDGLLFRLSADADGSVCVPATSTYYHLKPEDSPRPVPATLGGSALCLPLPLDSVGVGETLEMVWPQHLHSQGDCYCPPHQGKGTRFSDCISTETCNTDYSIAIVDNQQACFSNLSREQNNTPVYFTVVRSPCQGELAECHVRRVATSYSIVLVEQPEVKDSEDLILTTTMTTSTGSEMPSPIPQLQGPTISMSVFWGALAALTLIGLTSVTMVIVIATVLIRKYKQQLKSLQDSDLMNILNASPQGGQASTSAVLVAATPMSHDNGSPEYEVIQDMGRRRGPRHEDQHSEGNDEPQSSHTSHDAQPSGAVLTRYSITQCSAYGTAIQDQGQSHQVQHPDGSHEPQSSRSDDAQPSGAALTEYSITQCSAYGTTA